MSDATTATRAQAGPAPTATATPAAKRNNTRQRLFTILGLVVAVGAIGWGLYWLLVGSHYVSTDNAYVGADVAAITPQVAGAVTEVNVSDTQAVKTGDVLVKIDPADAKVAAERAEGGYGSAVRKLQQNFATNDAMKADVAAREADFARARAQVVAAESDVARTKIDLDRRQALETSGAVSGEELTTAKNAYQTAIANLTAAKAAAVQAEANRKVAQSQYEAQLALTKGTDVQTNPDVQTARSQLDAAKLDLSRTILTSPIDGVIAKRDVQVGQRVAVGAQLMTVVPIDKVYVDANFKEVQLKKVRVGQPVELTSDLYGKGVKYHGRVVGFAGGTGAAFAVIPAQNATGNWIKVVQRLPVRIALDPTELREHPLRVGLSMDAVVNVAAEAKPGAPPSAD